MRIDYLFAFALAAAAAGPTQAANIIWSAPVNATGNDSDVMTNGTLFAARTTGSTTTVNGVVFTGGFSGAITLGGVSSITGAFSAPNFTNQPYNALLGTGAFNNLGGSITISITGLSSGSNYAVQLFAPFWDANWATAFTGGNATSALVNATGPDRGVGASTVPQSLIGTFVASGTSQLITLSSPTPVNMIAAAQVRQIGTVPEPTSWAMLILGFGLIGTASRRRRSLAATA